jgi:hypothetical protein
LAVLNRVNTKMLPVISPDGALSGSLKTSKDILRGLPSKQWVLTLLRPVLFLNRFDSIQN